MPKNTTRKNLYYVRALNERKPVDVEALVSNARGKFPTVETSEVKLGSQDIIRIQHFTKTTSGTFVHFVRYVPGERAPTLSPKAKSAEDHGGAESPPEGKEFKDGDSFALINRHDVIFCAHGISIQKTTLYLSLLFEKAGTSRDKRKFELKPASKLDKLKLIQDHGVRAIQLSSSAYKVALPEKQRKNWFSKTFGSITDEISALVERDETVEEQKALQDLVIDVEIRLDGNTRARVESKDFIEEVAETVLDDLDATQDDFTIVTRNGEKISSSSIRMQTSINVTKEDRSVSHSEVWRGLEDYMGELRRTNLVEQ